MRPILLRDCAKHFTCIVWFVMQELVLLPMKSRKRKKRGREDSMQKLDIHSNDLKFSHDFRVQTS